MNSEPEMIEGLRATSILAAYRVAIQRIQFLCFSGGDMTEVERETVSVTDFETAVKAARSSDEIEDLMARRNES